MSDQNGFKNPGFCADKWAEEFQKVATKLGYPQMDEGWLIGWFANAIMTGYDEAIRKIEAGIITPTTM